MPIHSDRLQLSYFPIPKNGTSTLRAVFRAIEAGDSLSNVRVEGEGVAATPETAACGIRRARRDYEAAGTGTPIVFLHEFSGNWGAGSGRSSTSAAATGALPSTPAAICRRTFQRRRCSTRTGGRWRTWR